jgi:hypothetical protein
MGLDMSLSAKAYYSDATFRGEEHTAVFDKLVEITNVKEFLYEDLPSVEVAARVGYWRKANHIHRWFVENVQDGEDECLEHYVERSQLVELKGLCQWVLDNRGKAPETLPTQYGFFFGGDEYGEWYFLDLEGTIEIIEKCLKMDEIWEFYYQSSW